MASSLSNLLNNLSGGIDKIKCNCGHNDNKCKTCIIKYKYCNCFLEYTNFKYDLIECKCLWCDKNYQQRFDEKLKERFFNTYTFCSHGINKFILLLRKSFCLYECMDGWEKFNETSLSKKEDFHSHLNMYDVTDAGYTHSKKVWFMICMFKAKYYF